MKGGCIWPPLKIYLIGKLLDLLSVAGLTLTFVNGL